MNQITMIIKSSQCQLSGAASFFEDLPEPEPEEDTTSDDEQQLEVPEPRHAHRQAAEADDPFDIKLIGRCPTAEALTMGSPWKGLVDDVIHYIDGRLICCCSSLTVLSQ